MALGSLRFVFPKSEQPPWPVEILNVTSPLRG